MSGPIRLRPALRLIRLPNLFTAAADSLSGYLLCGGMASSPGRWLPLVIASMAIYAAGVALNDLLDLEVDRGERPGRPLPSGQLSRGFAFRVILAAFAIGFAASTFSGTRGMIAAAALIGCVTGYDALLRRTVLGPIAMGLCRAINVLMGMSIHPGFGGEVGWTVAVGYGLFIAGITWISRHETEQGSAREPSIGLVFQALALSLIAVATTRGASLPSPPIGRPIPPLFGQIVLLAISVRILSAGLRAARDPRPSTLQHAVRTGILSLIWIHTGLVAAIRGPIAALLIAGLWIPALIAARRIEPT